MKKYIISSDAAYKWPILSIITEEEKLKMLKQLNDNYEDYELAEIEDSYYLDQLDGDMHLNRLEFKTLLEEAPEITENEIQVLEKFDLLNESKVFDLYKFYAEFWDDLD